MPTLLMGHGGSDPSQKVVVPTGYSISFLVDDGAELPFYNGVGVVLNADQLEAGGFTLDGPYGAGDLISNHSIFELNGTQRAWYAHVDPEDGTCFYAGQDFDSGLALCTDPGPGSQCSEDHHTCGGIFSVTWPDTELVWVSCRYTPGGAGSQRTIGGAPSEFTDFIDEVWDKWQNLSEPEFATYFDSLPAEKTAMAIWPFEIQAWSYRRQIRSFMDDPATTDETFYAGSSPSTTPATRSSQATRRWPMPSSGG
jgi:hypothetical protein